LDNKEFGQNCLLMGHNGRHLRAAVFNGISGSLTRGFKLSVKHLTFKLPVTEAQTFIFGPDIGHPE
jgi:hypothetical protein